MIKKAVEEDYGRKIKRRATIPEPGCKHMVSLQTVFGDKTRGFLDALRS